MADELEWLQGWFQRQCNGDWEHGHTISISGLDNPGWALDIETADTGLDRAPFNKICNERSDLDWVHAQIEGTHFRAFGGPRNLTEMIRIFREWAERSA
jgi:hypothetical protein